MTTKLEDCICQWTASPIEVKYPRMGDQQLPDAVKALFSPAVYERDIVHRIDPECSVHSFLLEMHWFEPIPKVSNIAVEAVPIREDKDDDRG